MLSVYPSEHNSGYTIKLTFCGITLYRDISLSDYEDAFTLHGNCDELYVLAKKLVIEETYARWVCGH